MAIGPQMTKSEKSQAATVAVLLAAGFEPIGKLDALFGRRRFVKPGTALRVTVGKVTTCFYDVINGYTRQLVNVPTKRTRRIAFLVNESNGDPRLLGYRLVTVLEPAERAVVCAARNAPSQQGARYFVV